MKKLSRDPAALPLDHPEAIAARLEEMERKIDRLRSLYETFFSGAERRPPDVARRELNRLMLETQQIQIRNAALRFRFQSLSQRWILLTTYWNRTMREIETGTYRKDLARVSRRLAEKGAPLTEDEAIALGIPAGRARALVARQGNAAANQAARPATAAAARPDAVVPAGVDLAALAGLGLGERELADLHRRYETAARTAGRPGPSLEKLKQMLVRRAPELAAVHGAGALSLDVAVKDGRVVLRARPR